MSKLEPRQLNVQLVFGHKMSIIVKLYQLTLQTTHTTEELERSWEALARDNISADQPRDIQ